MNFGDLNEIITSIKKFLKKELKDVDINSLDKDKILEVKKNVYPKIIKKYEKADYELFSDISINSPVGEGGAYVQTTNYNNDAGVWSHAWFVWKATGKATGKTIQVPVHVAYKWDKNGTIAETYLFSDQAPQLAEINASQMQ